MMAAQRLWPPIVQKGLVDILNKIEKVYLMCALGNMLLDAVLTKEHIEAVHAYKAEQARIMSIVVVPGPGIIIPLPGMTLAPSLPTV